MSKVAIKGNASGTGTFTLEAPNSNTDRTLVLPDEAGTVLTTSSDVLAGGGLVVDQYYLTSNQSGDQTPVTAWTRTPSSNGFSPLGGGVSVSSGVFTFPQTGLYRVYAHMTYDESGGGTDNNINLFVYGSNNNFSSDFYIAAQQTAIYASNNRANATVMTFFKCSDTSNDKVSIHVSSQNNSTFGTIVNYSMCSFERVGDA